MNYYQNYFDFMESRQKLIRSKNDGVYYERHHILPKSIYPEYSKLLENLVLLTPREHFIAHYLLTKIFTGPYKYKMQCAFLRFCTGNAPNLKFSSSRLYEKVRKDWILNRPRCAHHLSEETKRKISQAEKGKIQSEATKQKLRESAKLQFADKEKREKHHKAMVEWSKNRTIEQKEKQLEWARKKKGPYSKERIEKAKKASIEALASILCIEDGTKWSCSRLSQEVNISRNKLKELILKGKEIHGKHFVYFREYWKH